MYYVEFKESFAFPDLEQLNGLRIVKEESKARRLRVLDTVDWSIWRSGQVLLQDDGGRMELYDRHDHLRVSVACKSRHAIIKKVPEPLARELKSLISVRALVSHFDCQWQVQSLVCCNQDDKIVSRAEIFTLGPAASFPSFMRLYPLRGYERETEQIVKALSPIAAPGSTAITTRFLLECSGLVARPPVTKPAFHLRADQATEEAVLNMLAELVRLARSQEEGLIADIDSEFTHQYRVNLRKARSLLSLFRKALTPWRYQNLRLQLKSMAKTTNRLRDLDVFLLDQQDYYAMLPDQFQRGLNALFTRLRRQRRQVWKRVISVLQGQDYLDRVAVLEQHLQQPPDVAGSYSQTPIGRRVSRKILSQYRRIQRDGARINATTPDARVHDLRIETKKLRYLLELFAELFPRDEVRELIKALKKLQDNLGRFNDYSAQSLFLTELNRTATTTASQRDAINALLAVLFSKQKEEREQVVALVADFSADKIAEQFRALFAPSATRNKRQ